MSVLAPFLPVVVLVGGLLLLLALRQPIIIVLAAAAIIAYTMFQDGEPLYVAYDIWRALNQEILLAIPLFMLAGAIMSKGSIAQRLIDLIQALTRPIPGGMAVATVLACAGFAAISGSSAVTLLAVGSIMYPALLKAGYSKSFSIGVICAGGTLGIIIPPSIPLILYGVMTNTSISDLFLAGILPGLMLTGLFAAYALVRNWKMRGQSWDGAEIGRALWRGIPSLITPGVILGGIYSGQFTATEAAAVAVVTALVIELLIHRDLKLPQLWDVTIDTSKLLGSLFPVLALATSLNIFLTWEQTPQELVAALEGVIHSKEQFLLISNALLLVVGCLIDVGSAILILSPLLQPLAEAQGIDPVHFGIIMTVNLEIGYLTPPMGLNLIVAAAAFREPFLEVCKAVIPFILIMLLGLLIVSFYPPLALGLIA
jgi:C4-dicarboxylate transporter DctM subunit